MAAGITGRRPLRLAAGAALALVMGLGGALAQAAAPAAGAQGRAASLRCFVLAAGVANSVQQQQGSAEQVGAFNTVAMFHLGRLVGSNRTPTAAEIEAELRAEQARPAEGRTAALRSCGEELQRVMRGLGGVAP